MAFTPSKEGFFWGRWHTPAPETQDDGECCAGIEWEVHFVFLNHDIDGDERFMVMVPGVMKAQRIDAFEWGEEVARPSYAGRL